VNQYASRSLRAGLSRELTGDGVTLGCNAWNHGASCACGWGGVGHGASSAGSDPGLRRLKAQWAFNGRERTFESYTRPNAHCPVCGALVFFHLAANGGRVFFDALGHPWPKHGCTDTGHVPRLAGAALTQDRDAEPPLPPGYKPVLQAQWATWTRDRPPSSVRVLRMVLGKSRSVHHAIVAAPRALDVNAPLLWRAHEDPRWIWLDAPSLTSPLLTCLTAPTDFSENELAEVSVQAGDAATLCALARACSFDREDVPGRANYAKARGWYEQAAKLGSAEAKNALGVFYELGLGVRVDADRALKFFRAAARAGSKPAKRNTARILSEGASQAEPGKARRTRLDA